MGPNINNTEIPAEAIAQAHDTLAEVDWSRHPASDLERDLIEALAERYADPAPDDRTPLNTAYAEAMREVYKATPDNPTVAALFAESLMILRPWGYWSPEGEPAPETPEIKETLEAGLAQDPEHPALCHFYIHAMEMSPTPEAALPAANRLRGAMPGAGHLVHMPSHIDVLMGDYAQVIETNQRAIEADQKFLAREGKENFYSLYRIHNYHFLVYGGMFDGQSELAMEAARAIPEQVTADLLRQWSIYLDAFMPTPLHVLVRFGKWEAILQEPEYPEYLPMSRAIRRYARAVAYAALGRVEEAEAEQAAFLRAKAAVSEDCILFNNTCLDILGVAEKMIAGEVAYRKGNYEEAFAHLREAVRLDDGLNYDEPWGWMQPARHALGALLLEQGHVEEAETVYRADLERHPNNVWALHGLAECLEKQGDTEAAEAVRIRFDRAAARCDVTVDRSCYCKNMDLAKNR